MTELVVNRNGAWCWFQDERAVVHGDTLLVGSVAAPEGEDGATRAGNVEVTVVDLASGGAHTVVLHENLEADDHNAPALWRRRDGRWLAVYTRHNHDPYTRWRLSEPDDPFTWGPERTFDWSEVGARAVTYSNVHELDGRLWCFARAVNDDPSALVSDDEGETFSYAGKVFTRPKVGYVNGYTRYASSPGRIDLVTTDHHPRDYDNSIHHAALTQGALVDSSGTVVAPVAPSGDAPSQVDATTVLPAGSVVGGAVLTHCWTTDLRRGSDGTLVALLSARADDDEAADEAGGAPVWRLAAGNRRTEHAVADLRLIYARLVPGGTWEIQPLARMGAGLLPHEQDYCGLGAVDPYDLSSVYVSTPVDPRDGATLDKYEIFHGRTADGGATWVWDAVTEGSTADNLRPIVAPGDPGRVVLCWFRGTMTASQHYDCEVVVRVSARAS